MNNEYGLDAEYFKKNLRIITRDADRYTPNEMARALRRLAVVAQDTRAKSWPGIPAGPNQPFPGR